MKNQIIVTTSWDDGHKLDLKLAKLLKKYEIKGTFYISPKNREFKKEDLLSDEEIIKINKGFEIGAHTMTHPRLTQINETDALKEIYKSKNYLENLLHKKIKSFCYPGGKYNKKIVNIVKEAEFTCARTVDEMVTFPKKNFFQLGTTIQIQPLTTRDFCGLVKLSIKNNIKLLPLIVSKDWEKIAKKIFNYVEKHGGIYHFWGHSWIVDKYKEWEKLELFLSYISRRKNVKYMTNYEIVKVIK